MAEQTPLGVYIIISNVEFGECIYWSINKIPTCVCVGLWVCVSVSAWTATTVWAYDISPPRTPTMAHDDVSLIAPCEQSPLSLGGMRARGLGTYIYIIIIVHSLILYGLKSSATRTDYQLKNFRNLNNNNM